MEVSECRSIISLMPLIESWQNECNARMFDINMEINEILRDVLRMIESNESIIFVLSDKEKVVGVMGLVIFKSPLGSQRIANEHYWYVLPEHRGRASLKLLAAGKAWAKEKRCSHIIANASMLASDLHDSVCHMYEEIGMKKFETTYIMALKED